MQKKGHAKKVLQREKQIERYCIRNEILWRDPYRVGKMSMQEKMQIFRSTVIQTIYHDIETRSKITERQIEKLGEKKQKSVLTNQVTTKLDVFDYSVDLSWRSLTVMFELNITTGKSRKTAILTIRWTKNNFLTFISNK